MPSTLAEQPSPTGACHRREDRRPGGAAQVKVQSLLPRKLNGIATATAIAWAASSEIDEDATSASSRTRLITRQATETARKRAACRWASPYPGPNVQKRFPRELLATASD